MEKVYITKHWETKGVYSVSGEESKTSGIFKTSGNVEYHGEGQDWHRTVDGARSRAQVLANAKVRSLDLKSMKIKAFLAEVSTLNDTEIPHECEPEPKTVEPDPYLKGILDKG